MMLHPSQGNDRGGWHRHRRRAVANARSSASSPPTRWSSSARTRSTASTTARWSTGTSPAARGHDGDHRGRARRRPVRRRPGGGRRGPDYAYKPEEPARTVTTEVFVFAPADARPARGSGRARREGPGGPRRSAAPELVEAGRRARPLAGYWRDVGTVDAYWRRTRTSSTEPPIDLDDPAWPVHTRAAGTARPGAARRGGRRQPGLRRQPGGRDGARLGALPGVVVEEGARSWTRSCCPGCACARARR